MAAYAYSPGASLTDATNCVMFGVGRNGNPWPPTPFDTEMTYIQRYLTIPNLFAYAYGEIWDALGRIVQDVVEGDQSKSMIPLLISWLQSGSEPDGWDVTARYNNNTFTAAGNMWIRVMAQQLSKYIPQLVNCFELSLWWTVTSGKVTFDGPFLMYGHRTGLVNLQSVINATTTPIFPSTLTTSYTKRTNAEVLTVLKKLFGTEDTGDVASSLLRIYPALRKRASTLR